MKKIVFLLCSACVFLSLNVFAQKQNTYYIKNNGDYVTTLDSADFIRVVREPEKGSKLYPTNEYYLTGEKKSYGNSSLIDPAFYEGQYVSFYKNGMKKKFMNFVRNKVVDSVFSYFSNGKLYSSSFYSAIGDSSVIYLRTLNDSTGTTLVQDGNGRAVVYDEDFKYVTGTGNVKNGRYDGEWTGELRTSADTLRYKEVYAEGKMLSGESADGKGNVYHYTTSYAKPTFKGGMDNFYRQVGRGVRYPPNAARQGIQGAANIKFVILTNGEISDVHANNDVDPALAAEAVRMIKSLKGWQPARLKGRLIDVSFAVPITFMLGR
jgi:TonB family protein